MVKPARTHFIHPMAKLVQSIPVAYCFDHAQCLKHNANSYGIAETARLNQYSARCAKKSFRVPKNVTSWKSTCPKGCRKQEAELRGHTRNH